MKKILKTALITIPVLLVLLVSVVATIPLWLPLDKVKTLAVSRLSTLTGRDVAIDGLKLNLLKGLELSGVSIKEARPRQDENFISDDKIYLSYNLLALLKKDLIITELRLDSPSIQITKNSNGTYNYSDIMKTVGFNSVIQANNPKINYSPQPEKSFINSVIITGVKINNGSIKFTDKSKAEPFEFSAVKLNLDASNFVLGALKQVPVSASCTLVYGKYSLPVSVNSGLTIDLAKNNIDFIISSMKAAGIPCEGDISIKNFRDIYGKLNSTISYGDLMQFVDAKTKEQLAANNITCEMDITNKLAFEIVNDKMGMRDEVQIEKGALRYGKNTAVDNLSGKISLNDAYELSGALHGTLAGSDTSMNLKTTSVLKMPGKGRVDVVISSKKLALDYFMALLPEKKAGAAGPGKSAGAEAEIKPLPPLPEINVKLNADSASLNNVTTGAIKSDIIYRNNQVDADLAADAFDGTLSGRISANLVKTTYAGSMAIRNMDMNKLTSAFFALNAGKTGKNDILSDLNGKVFGTLALNTSFSGSTFADMPHSMKSDGGFQVTNGKLSRLQMEKDLYDKTNAEIFNRDITFDIMSASYKMTGGKIETNDFKIESGENGNGGDLRVRANGYVTVDDALDFKVQTDMSPKISAQLSDTASKSLNIADIGYANNEDGWMPFDFRVYNTIESKKYDFWQARMSENIKRNMGKKIQEEGGKLLNGLKGLFK